MLGRPGTSASGPPRYLQQPHIRLEQNKQRLATRELGVLVRWARRYRSCAQAAAVRLEQPMIGRDEVTIAAANGTTIRIREFAACERLGAPPLLTALVLAHDGMLHRATRARG